MILENLDQESKGGLSIRVLLASLGFICGDGFEGEVWTNVESAWMTQVWIRLKGDHHIGLLGWDATKGLDVAAFFKWWEEMSAESYHEERY